MWNGGGCVVPMASWWTQHVLRCKHRDEVHQQHHIYICHSVTSISSLALHHNVSIPHALISLVIFRQNSEISSYSITVTTYLSRWRSEAVACQSRLWLNNLCNGPLSNYNAKLEVHDVQWRAHGSFSYAVIMQMCNSWWYCFWFLLNISFRPLILALIQVVYGQIWS